AYSLLFRLRHWLGTLPAEVECYNCDLDVASYYLYARRLYPCAWYHLEAGQGGSRLRRLDPLEEAFALEFSPPPPLTILTLSLTRDPLIPLAAGNGLSLGWEGRTLELAAPDRPGLLGDLARLLRRLDPDLVLSDGGDEEIIPTLSRWSRETGTPLPLDRERGPVDRKFGAARSYFSYGRIVYQGAAVPFYGRWHLDRRNSFYYRESGLAGLMQISRIGQMPLQRAARASPGTLITSMQLSRAIADGILIPWRKGEPEGFKTAGQLLTIDKGGLSFMPPPGLYFNVAEVDFASMYPTIMMRHNISPETVNCPCCGEGAAGKVEVGEGAMGQRPLPPPPHPLPQPPKFKIRLEKSEPQAPPSPASLKGVGRGFGGGRGSVAPPALHQLVPEAGYHLCRQREGLVPRTLRPILALREQLKARAREVGGEAAAPYRERQTALKWMLVTCFGYLGYKNARFGKIEAHEAVNAFSREALLTAKEIAEANGYHLVHAIIDCLWLKKQWATHQDYLHLCKEIKQIVGINISLEGIYRWILFPSSKTDINMPTAGKYVGWYDHGEIKMR